MPATLAVVDRATALDFLFNRINYERTTQIPYQSGEFKLERMHQLLAELGNPHLSLPAVHIAGTKGKGSTATMVAAILHSAGYRTGLYTSPHLERLEERFVVNGQLCSEDEFVQLAADVQAAAMRLEANSPEGRSPTYFEITTAMGFLHFARSKVDIAVLEVGLGGRLDSTNVCHPLVSVITSISFDHTKQLGNTLAAIAREKAGIIKPGVPVVSGVIDTEPREVIEQAAADQQAPLFQRSREFHFQLASRDANAPTRVVYQDATGSLGPLEIGMVGPHQAANAATAIAAIRHLPRDRFVIAEADIRQGLQNANCPGRVEIIQTEPTVILDVAHNVASIAALVETIHQRFQASPSPTQRRVLVFASSRDKDALGMLRRLLPAFQHVILTRYVDNPRAFEPAELLALAAQVQAEAPNSVTSSTICETTENPQQAWQRASELVGAEDLVCITGSFFLAAELRPFLVNRHSRPF